MDLEVEFRPIDVRDADEMERTVGASARADEVIE